jgi:WD40 repeat protein
MVPRVRKCARSFAHASSSGHTGTVVGVSFSSNGDHLVSYAYDETPPTIRCWKVSSSGLLSSLLNIQGEVCAQPRAIRSCGDHVRESASQAAHMYKLSPMEKK